MTSPTTSTCAAATRSRQAENFTIIERPPRLRPKWPMRPLRCPLRGSNSRLGSALRRSSSDPPLWAADREVLDPRRARKCRIVQVASVEEQRMLEPRAERFKILTAEFLPFRDDYQ